MSAARQRTASQKKPEDFSSTAAGELPETAERAGLISEALIQDSQEQEQEIRKLRRENAASNESAHTTLDVGVMTNLLLTGLQASSSYYEPELRNFLAIGQFFLLLFSVTPDIVPYVKTSWANPFYPYVFRIQVALALTAVYDLYEHGKLSIPAVFRWVLPAIVAGAVWLQRRGEQQAEEKLAKLEKLKYNVKGA